MEQRAPQEYVLEIFADQTFVKDIVKGQYSITLMGVIIEADLSHSAVLHTIFFHRYFPSIRPSLRDLPHLDITLPYIADPPEIENLIDARTTTLVHQLTSANTPNGGVRGQIAIQFFEKRRRKSGWLGGMGRGGDEEVCWEEWLLEITIAKPKTDSGMPSLSGCLRFGY
jgi:autophagy-related protein 101